MKTSNILFYVIIFTLCVLAQPVLAQEGDDADLAQDLSNPVADLITIPVQVNYDRGIGPLDDG